MELGIARFDLRLLWGGRCLVTLLLLFTFINICFDRRGETKQVAQDLISVILWDLSLICLNLVFSSERTCHKIINRGSIL